MKFNIEIYLNISEFLKTKTQNDFQNHKKEFYKNHKKFDEKKRLNYLLEYYDYEKKDENNNKEYSSIHTFILIKKFLPLIFLLLGFFITWFWFDKDEINLKIYFLVSIIPPFIILFYAIYKQFFSNNKSDLSFLIYLLKKINFQNFEFNKDFLYVIKISKLFIWIAIWYEIGILIATITIFSVFSVTFYSGTTYGANDYQITRNINVSSTKNIKTEKKYTQYSSAFWSKIITFLLIIMIFSKLLLYFLVQKKSIKIIKEALINSGDEFFYVLKNNVYIGQSEKNIKIEKQNLDTTEIKKVQKKELTKDDINHYDVLYYQIDLEEQSKINFNLSNEESLKNKTFSSYAYRLFGKKEEDNIILKKLKNLVIIYTSPQTIPDEQFKRNMLEILNLDNVHYIWIIPLKDENNRFSLIKKDDKDYAKWDKIIKKINDKNIRIYSEL
jgi:hypothetical protein